MKAWFKKIGYYENPFLINPLKERTTLYAQDKQLEDALYYTESGTMMFVEAAKGCGKTKFLRKIIDNYTGRIIYVNALKLTKNLNVEELLKKRNGMKGKLFGAKPKNMILLLDNVQELTAVNLERLKYYYDQGFLQSVIFTGESLEAVGFHRSILNRIGKRIVRLAKLSKEDALALVYERLDEDQNDPDVLIAPVLVEKIFEKSNKNPKQFLANLHRVFEEMGFDDAERVSEEHLTVLDEPLEQEDELDLFISLGADVVHPQKELVDARGNPLMKVGEYYRCPVYDMFCGNCGAIVKQEDIDCPECGAEFENIVEEETEQDTTKKKEKATSQKKEKKKKDSKPKKKNTDSKKETDKEESGVSKKENEQADAQEEKENVDKKTPLDKKSEKSKNNTKKKGEVDA